MSKTTKTEKNVKKALQNRKKGVEYTYKNIHKGEKYMKKTLATLLVVALVASVCGVMFVSAESVNLAAGKEVANAENVAADVTTLWIDTDLTDGKVETGWEILWTAGQWFGYWWNPDSASAAEWTNAPEGVATPTIDLGAVCSVDKVRVNMFLGSDMGIIPAQSVTVKVSTDGENYTEVATTTLEAPAAGDTTVGWVEFALEAPVDAQYVCVEMVLGAVWLFVDEIEIYGTAPAGSDEPVEPDAPATGKTWENTMVEGENGNYSCEVPYGYTWNVNYVDGTIAGEDVTVCTTQAAYDVCNPNWAITVYLEKQADGTYVALQDAIVTPGTAAAAGITIGENQIALVAHSAYSNPNGSNWQGKVVAMSVKAGDVFTVSDDFSTVVAVDPNAAPETPDTPITGDAGILVFAVLAVVAVAGCAVASKIKSSAL